MTKTVETQIEKCRGLIAGLRAHMAEVHALGISGSGLDALEQDLTRLSAASDECEAMRAQLTAQVRAMNAILAQVKETYATTKQKIKAAYPQDQWLTYGVPDKR